MKHIPLTFTIVGFASLCLAGPKSEGRASDQVCQAIRNNDLTSLRRLVRAHGVKVKDFRGNSPLMVSAASGSLECMRFLLSQGADPNAANLASATPLMWSVGDIAKTRMLLSKGARVDVKSKMGLTPLQAAVLCDRSPEVVKLLIQHGANVNACDSGKTSTLEAAAATGNPEVVRTLVENGANVNWVDSVGFTPLLSSFLSVGNPARNAEVVKLLLSKGAKVNAKTKDVIGRVENGPFALGRITVLMLAGQLGNADAIKILLAAGADVNATDVRNMNALEWAVGTDHANPEVVKLLIDAGSKTKNALKLAFKFRNPAVVSQFGETLAPLNERAPAAQIQPVSRARVRAAMAKGLVILQATAANFSRTGGCMACHAQDFTGMAVLSCKPPRIKCDFKLEAIQASRSSSNLGYSPEELFQGVGGGAGPNSVAYKAHHLSMAGVPCSLRTDAMVHYLNGLQAPDGNWPINEARPPINDGTISITARCLRVLRSYPVPSLKSEIDMRVKRAADWLIRAEPLTTEDRSMQILGIQWAGKKVSADRVKTLVSRQRPCGGWGQSDSLPVDAYATGEVLWALHESGMSSVNPIFSRGVAYLVRTQQSDGSWHVLSRSVPFQPYFETGFPHGRDQFISQAGSAFAIIALSYASK